MAAPLCTRLQSSAFSLATLRYLLTRNYERRTYDIERQNHLHVVSVVFHQYYTSVTVASVLLCIRACVFTFSQSNGLVCLYIYTRFSSDECEKHNHSLQS